MIEIHNFYAFLMASVLLNLTPGPDTLYILGRSIGQGKSAGVASVLGISSGSLLHTFMAAIGLSTIVATSAYVFTCIKILGAVYLVYIGISMIFGNQSAPKIKTNFSTVSFLRIYRQGLLTNTLNPKVALFFLAFVPQFINHDANHTFLSFMALGGVFVLTGTIWGLIVAFVSAKFATFINKKQTIQKRLNSIVGLLFTYLGIKLAFSK